MKPTSNPEFYLTPNTNEYRLGCQQMANWRWHCAAKRIAEKRRGRPQRTPSAEAQAILAWAKARATRMAAAQEQEAK